MIEALIRDLGRPMGGWTAGFVSIFGAIGVLSVSALGLWPLHDATATVAAALLLVYHLMWGMTGYYPRRI
jgi:hypothetical protein